MPGLRAPEHKGKANRREQGHGGWRRSCLDTERREEAEATLSIHI